MTRRPSTGIRMTLRRATGFTLIEVLVAISITVVVAGIAYTFFDRAIQASETSETVLKDVNELETIWQVIATDVHHMVDRPLPTPITGPGASSGSVPTFLGGDPSLSGANYLQGEYTLRFMRDGWANPLHQARSDLQRVGYRWYDGYFWRDYWAERNQPFDSEPTGRRLLSEHVTAIRIRFLPQTSKGVAVGPWVDNWPSANANNSQANGNQGAANASNLPAAFEITLTLEGLGDVQRTFAMPGV